MFEHEECAERARFVQSCEIDIANALAGSDDFLTSLATDSLVALTQATGAAVVLNEGIRTIGIAPAPRVIEQIIGWLKSRGEDLFCTEKLSEQMEQAEQWDQVAAGMVSATISRDLGEYLLWFRPSSERASDCGPPKATSVSKAADSQWLSSSGSFELRRETAPGRSLPWERWQLDAASGVRRLLLGVARKRVANLQTLNQRLADADYAKDMFIATISHELRNPLAAITGWTRLYLDGSLPVGRRDDVLKIVARNAAVLSNLVDDLLDTSRMLAGNIALDVESVEFAALIESVVTSMSVATNAKGLRVTTALDPSAGPLLGDPVRLRQVVSNLLSNAIKFTPQGGSIALLLARIGQDLEFLVRDTGIGLAPASKERIFETFWQVDGSTARTERGLGLGLSIAKRLIELHGGSVSVESAGLGFGTTFRVVLPIALTKFADSQPPPKSAGSRIMHERPLEGKTVLLVEDEQDARSLVHTILAQAGAEVVDVENAKTALETLSARHFDAVISDVGLPGMDGIALVTAIRNHAVASIAHVPAIALTAYSRATDRAQMLRAGFQGHLAKPTDPEELVAVMASIMLRAST